MDSYDRLFVGMAGSLLLGLVVGLHSLVDLHYGLVGGSVLATFLLWEVLFRNPPVPPSDPHCG